MKELMIFKNEIFGTIRTIEENGKILFCGSDVAKSLGYSEPHKAIARHTKGGMKHAIPTKGGIQQMIFIPEGDIYRLVVKSQLPLAEEFESWIFDEILPSVRRHGMYAKDELLDNPDLMIQILNQLKEERQQKNQLQKKIEIDRPKVLFSEAVNASHSSILVGDLAKILKQNGVDTGANRFFQWLRDNGFLIKRKGADYNMPTQYSMELSLFEVKETTITHSDGHISVSKTPKVTGKGQQYFINKFLSKKLEIEN